MRTVFMGTPEFAVPCLDALLAAAHEVAAVYTRPDRPAGRGRAVGTSPVKRAADARGIKVEQPATLRDGAAVARLARYGPEAIVVAAYGLILPQQVLDVPRYGCLNVHPSLLPRHRGPAPVAWAILEGDEVTGVTIMLMDAGMDTGPILAQRQAPVMAEDTTPALTDRLARLGASMLPGTLEQWARGEVTPLPQDEARATYSRAIAKEDGEVDWAAPAAAIWRRTRAFFPWPGCYTWHRGRMLKLLETVPLPELSGGTPGRVVGLPGGMPRGCKVGVETGSGVLGLLRVQLEGRREMTADEFARGQRDLVGSVLPLRA